MTDGWIAIVQKEVESTSEAYFFVIQVAERWLIDLGQTTLYMLFIVYSIFFWWVFCCLLITSF